MTRTLWEWVWHFPTCPGMQNPWQWHKGWWLSIARKECKVTMACRLSWHWQIFAGVSKVRWYCLYGMICRKEMFGSDTLISFSFSAQVYLTCRIHTVKWQDIRGFKWKQKKIGQRKVNTEYLAYLSWKKKWKKEGHQVCHQVHLVPKPFERNEISLILKETELILDGIKDRMT